MNFILVDLLLLLIQFYPHIYLMHFSYSQGVIYTCFTKVFDHVYHTILIKSLILTDFGDPLLLWIRSYLTKRKQQVTVHGVRTCYFSPSSAVLQGTVLLLVFATLVNFALSVLHHAKLLIFADDMNLYLHNDSIADYIIHLYTEMILIVWYYGTNPLVYF